MAQSNLGRIPRALAEIDTFRARGSRMRRGLDAVECLERVREILVETPIQRPSGTHSTPGRPLQKRREAADFLIDLYQLRKVDQLPAGLVRDAALAHGITQKTLRRAALDLGIVKDPPGGGRTCVWTLPSDLESELSRAAA